MTVNLSLLGGAGWQFSDNNGSPLSGGLLYSYQAGTALAANTYTSASGVTPNSNPVVLNAAGRVQGEIWLTQGQAYKFVLKTSTGVTLGTYDNVPGANDLTALNTFEAALAAPTGSSLVGFIQSGTGAVATTVQTKLRESVSVKDFGAVGNGVADDTAAIQACFAASTGKTINFPAGFYLVTGTISLDGLGFAQIKFYNAKILCGANNITVFKSVINAWGVKIFDPFIVGNGFTGCVAFNTVRLTSLGAGIFRPVLRDLDVGIYLNTLSVAAIIDSPDINNVGTAIILNECAGAVTILHPKIDLFTTVGIKFEIASVYGNVGAQIIGGYIQNGPIGILDACVDTQVYGTYFEGCSVADISLINGSLYFLAEATNHTGSGVVAIKSKNSDAARIFHPFMSASGRSIGLFDFDASNTNATSDLVFGINYKNVPVGIITGIKLNHLPEYAVNTWVPTLGGTSVIVANYSSYTKVGRLVTVDFDITVTSIGTGNTNRISGLPYIALGIKPAGSISFLSGSAVTTTYITCWVGGGGNEIYFSGISAASSGTSDLAIFTTGTRVSGSITYATNS
jgi:hypothetical protein